MFRSRKARQWRTLALILARDHAKTTASLEELIEHRPTRTTALLWAVIAHSHNHQTADAVKRLTEAVQEARPGTGDAPENGAGIEDMDDQGLYDRAINAVALGDLAKANILFRALLGRSPEAGDVPVWLALLAAAGGHWTAARDQLKDSCQTGSLRSKALAHHLASVVYALEDRPDLMIQSMLTGQRLRSRGSLGAHTTTQPQRDVTWFSDRMK